MTAREHTALVGEGGVHIVEGAGATRRHALHLLLDHRAGVNAVILLGLLGALTWHDRRAFAPLFAEGRAGVDGAAGGERASPRAAALRAVGGMKE